MARQIILDEKFTSIQEAQAGLYRLLESAQKAGRFYRSVYFCQTKLGKA